MLLGITHTGPVRVTELGTGGTGIVWEVAPENFPSLIDMINRYGGVSHWRIEALGGQG